MKVIGHQTDQPRSTDAPSVKVRDTAERETPAALATSFKVTDTPTPTAL